MNFDRPPQSSPFLKFVRQSFFKTEAVRNKPYNHLRAKKNAFEAAVSQGFQVPNKIAFLSDINDLRNINLPDKFVVKPGNGFSSKGVMPLERAGDKYINQLSLDIVSLDEIIERQNKLAITMDRCNFIVEEFISSTIYGRDIPFDYKFYTFGRRIGLIVQVDRNVNPPKMCLFDGAFVPLIHGVDYIFRSRQQLGVPIIPLHAYQMIAMAQQAGGYTGAPFVSVDLYDSPSGPVFGEYTFGPGGTAREMWKYSDTLLSSLDKLFENNSCQHYQSISDLKLDVDQIIEDSNILSRNGYTLPIDTTYYAKLASYAYSHGSLATTKLAAYYRKLELESFEQRSLAHHTSCLWQLVSYIISNRDDGAPVDVMSIKNSKYGLSREHIEVYCSNLSNSSLRPIR